jgi:hypothetical protein
VKTIKLKALVAASFAIAFFSCKPEIDFTKPSQGSIDVSKYVAIGNSNTAGYADNALYHGAQLVTYSNLLAQQFKAINGSTFKQPLVSAASVGIGSLQNARYALSPSTDCAGSTSLAPVQVASNGDFSIFTTSVASEGPFNNMGVPGVKATTAIFPGYGNPANGIGNYNPFFTRMTTNPASASILSEAAAQNPTFFTMSMGDDDALTYALAGGAADAITPSAGAPGFGFDASIDVIVNTLTANGSKGAIAGIPHITNMPYFVTIPYNGLLLDAANAAALNGAYAPLGITFQAGYNGFIIEDMNAPGGLRQIVNGELILLSIPQDSIKCGGWGSMKAIPNQYVLTNNEIVKIEGAINAYNVKLKSVADAKGLAFVDVNAFMSSLKTGIIYNGVSVAAQYVSGGAFSLDGVNLTPIGNALLANQFIKAINAKYGSSIQQIDASKYKGIIFP